MRNVYLHGRLKDSFGEVFRIECATAGEALRALNVNLAGFADALKEGSFRLVRGSPETGIELDLDSVNELKLGQADFHLIPVAEGAKNGGALKTIIGVALIGTAIFFSGGTLLAPLSGMGTAIPGLGGGITWGNLAMLGLASSLAGVSQLLAKSDEAKTQEDDSSFLFSGPVNVADQSVAVPLVYGHVITGSVSVSAGLDVENLL